MARQDSSFYTNTAGMEIVWDGDPNGRFYVVRNGEMRINAITDAGVAWIIRYTDQLEQFGITTDEELQAWTDKGEPVFNWINNSWFELVDNNDPEDGTVYDYLDDAIAVALDLSQRQADGE
jgi:hypothetical protein